MSEVSISIVIPAYNEEARLPKTLAAIFASEYLSGNRFEVVLSIEPSGDKTLEIARQWADRHAQIKIFPGAQKRGKGHAVKNGMLGASGEYVFFMDADLSVPIGKIKEFIEVFLRDPDLMVVFGSRRHPESDIKVSQNFLRQMMGVVFNHAVRLVSGLPWLDTQCGFKAFRQKSIIPLFGAQILDGFAFDVEILMLAEKLKFKVAEQPVVWSNSPQSHVKIVKDSCNMLLDIHRVKRFHK